MTSPILVHAAHSTIAAATPLERVLVTGGAGFVGSRIVEQLTGRGVCVAVLDNLSVGLPMPTASRLVLPVEGDIRDKDAIDRLFRGFAPQAVVHLAAVHHIPTCERERAYSLEVNVIGTEVILAASESSAVDLIVLASSGAVYDWQNGALEEDRSALAARDNYALAKLTNERQLAFWCDRTGKRGRIARLFNVIGPGDRNAHLIPDILRQIPLGAHEITIQLGNCTTKRDYICVDDAAAGFLAILTAAGTGDSLGPEAFNLCTGVEHSVFDLVEQIGAATGVRIKVEFDPARARRVDRPGQLGNPTKSARQLGWIAESSLADAIELTVIHAAPIASTPARRTAS
jgi:UDP-glucose 4-epimerase